MLIEISKDEANALNVLLGDILSAPEALFEFLWMANPFAYFCVFIVWMAHLCYKLGVAG